MTVKLYVLALACLWLTEKGQGVGKSGPFDFTLEKIERCQDPGTEECSFPTRLSKVSRNKATLSGLVRLDNAIDSHSKVYIDLQQWGNQGYRPRSFEYTMVTCEKVWKMASNIVKSVFASAGVNITGCPLPAGNYTLDNFDFDFDVPIPVMLYGKYRMVVSIFQTRRKICCAMFYGDVTPKQSN